MLQLDATALAARLDRGALIDALGDAFQEAGALMPAQGLPGASKLVVPPRERYDIEAAHPGERGGTLLVMPAWRVGSSLGLKLVTIYPDNTLRALPAVAATYLLLDASTGQPRALLDGGELTLRRTGAASALASRHLSVPDASRLLMVGTGRLAPHLIESHAAVRPIREVRIWGRRGERAGTLAASLNRPELRVAATDDLEATVRWADLVSCATLSQRPLVLGSWLKPGQHVDLVGAYSEDMCEVDDEAIRRCELFVDTRIGALAESGEIMGAISRNVIDKSAVRAELSDLGSGRFARSSARAITLFKSVGTALEDLVAAELAIASLPRS
jgi:alanine dehydrogenase